MMRRRSFANAHRRK